MDRHRAIPESWSSGWALWATPDGYAAGTPAACASTAGRNRCALLRPGCAPAGIESQFVSSFPAAGAQLAHRNFTGKTPAWQGSFEPAITDWRYCWRALHVTGSCSSMPARTGSGVSRKPPLIPACTRSSIICAPPELMISVLRISIWTCPWRQATRRRRRGFCRMARARSSGCTSAGGRWEERGSRRKRLRGWNLENFDRLIRSLLDSPDCPGRTHRFRGGCRAHRHSLRRFSR